MKAGRAEFMSCRPRRACGLRHGSLRGGWVRECRESVGTSQEMWKKGERVEEGWDVFMCVCERERKGTARKKGEQGWKESSERVGRRERRA